MQEPNTSYSDGIHSFPKSAHAHEVESFSFPDAEYRLSSKNLFELITARTSAGSFASNPARKLFTVDLL